jgi:hypothetical protein
MADEVCRRYTAVRVAGKRKGGQDILLDLWDRNPTFVIYMILE